MRSINRSLELMNSTQDDLHSERITVIHHSSNSTAFSFCPAKVEEMSDSVLRNLLMINTLDTSQVALDTHEIRNFSLLFLLSNSYSLEDLEYSKRITNILTLDNKRPDKKHWKSFVHLLKEVFTFFRTISNVPYLHHGENLAFSYALQL